MFHLVSYKCIRRTQYIPRFGGVLQEQGILLGGCLTCEDLVGVTWSVSDCEELVGEVTGDDGVGFTECYFCPFPFTTLECMFPSLS